MIVSFFPADLITDFLLHEYYHLLGFLFELMEKTEEDGGGDVIGDIGDNGIITRDVPWYISTRKIWHIFQDIPLYDRENRLFWDNQIAYMDSVVQDIDHLLVELDQGQGSWFPGEYFLGQCSISGTDLEDILSGYLDAIGDSFQDVIIDQKILSERLLCSDAVMSENFLMIHFYD